MGGAMAFTNLGVLAEHLRQELKTKKFILIYAYNGTGKTRLSTAFKDLGKVVNTDDEAEQQDTLYFNAFTEDLFSWDNDLENDSERKLTLNTDSSFFAGLESMEMDNRIRTLLDRYADFEFRIDTTTWEVIFAREFRVKKDGTATRSTVRTRGRERAKASMKPAARRPSRSPVARRTSSSGASSSPSSSSRSMTMEPVRTTGSSTFTSMTRSHRSMSTTPSPWQIIWRSCSRGRRAGSRR